MQIAPFVLLGAAILLCWAPPFHVRGLAIASSAAPAILALGLALSFDLVGPAGLAAFGVLATTCVAAMRSRSRVARTAARLLAAATAIALATGRIPGFAPVVVIPEQVLAEGAVAYTRRVHFSGAFGGYLLLAIVARPQDVSQVRPSRVITLSATGAIVVIALAAPLAIAVGYLRFDPRMTAGLLAFASTIALFTAVPEEALFRGLLQGPLHRALDGTVWRPATVPLCAIAFGLVHITAGPVLVVLATISGAVAAVIYARSRYVAIPICMHTFVNIGHYVFFTYPRLQALAP